MLRERTDAELVAAAAEGERLAFSALIARHGARARGVARLLLRDADGAEDVEQEAVLAAYLGLSRLREPARFGAWLAAIAANLARMRLSFANGSGRASLVKRRFEGRTIPWSKLPSTTSSSA